MQTIAETISRVRGALKAVKEDAFLTDREIYSVVLKYAKTLVRRQDNEGKIMNFQSLFEVIPCVELVEVDKIEACCGGIKTKCTIRRTADKIPAPLEGSVGPLFRSVASIDSSQEIYNTQPSIYVAMTNSTNFKYNKNYYYWYLDGHLYFPNIEWDAVRVDAIWDDDITYLKCGTKAENCLPRQEQNTHVPDYLFSEIEQHVMRDFAFRLQVPTDNQDDNKNPLR